MLRVVRAVVRSLDIDYLELSWELENTLEDIFDYTFQIQRSESPEGPFSNISVEFQDRYSFLDELIVVGHKWRQLFYKIVVKRKRDSFSETFGPYSSEPEPDLIAIEIRRNLVLLMQEHAGRRCWVLPRKTFGQRCSCWDDVLGKQSRAGCRECFDTGFVGGYLSPIETWIQIDPSPRNDQAALVLKTQQVLTTMRMANYPPIKPDDLIVEMENRRWVVVSATATEHSRAPLLTEASIREVQPKDVEFAVPLHLDTALKNIWATPPRNFSNPHSLESFERDQVPNILELYQTRRW